MARKKEEKKLNIVWKIQKILYTPRHQEHAGKVSQY
jgi:hypothetical protein